MELMPFQGLFLFGSDIDSTDVSNELEFSSIVGGPQWMKNLKLDKNRFNLNYNQYWTENMPKKEEKKYHVSREKGGMEETHPPDECQHLYLDFDFGYETK